MPMAGSIALYSSSPSAIWASQSPTTSSGFDVDAHCRPQSGQHTGPKHVIGGLSSLFASPVAKFSSGGVCDVLDSAYLSNYSSGMIRSRSQNDLCTVREGADSWCGAVNIPVSATSKLRECSPVSVFQGPSSYASISSCKLSASRDNSGSCNSPFSDSHFGLPRRRYSLPLENRYPVARHEGFEINKVQSWSNFASGALASYIECDNPLKLFDDADIGESFTSGSSSVQLGSSPSDSLEALFPVENDFTIDRSDGGGLYDRTDSHKGLADLSLIEPLYSPVLLYESTYASEFASSYSLGERIWRSAVSRHEIFKDPLVMKAFKEAERAHWGQFRATGDPYLVHCVETALLLAAAGASKTVVAAGLLHDTLDDCSWDQKQLRANFGDDVTDLVMGVSRLSEFSQLARDNNVANKMVEADRLRIMFLAMVDVRVVLIKFADRLHNMRTLGALSEAKQQRIANETLEIFAPLASRLGIWSWKAEMEDLCFRYLKPFEHERLKEELAKGSREVTMMSAIQKLDQALREEGIFFHDLCGRSKNLYSIYSKMMRKNRRVDEIYDVRGLRLIVANEDGCYNALNVVHRLWSHIPEKLKDYISCPKSNGYQSLHTVVIGDDQLPLEVQIRTMEMHHQSEFGMAAHWRYKEGNCEHSSSILQRVEWARWVLTWHSELLDTKLRLSPLEMDLRPPCPFPFHIDGCPHSMSQGGPPECEDDPVFVIILEDEKMGVQELPSGSTAADLLTRIYGRVSFAGNTGISSWKETRLRINHEIVNDLKHKLQMGDLIELAPFFTAEVLDKCRDKIRRMYGDEVYL